MAIESSVTDTPNETIEQSMDRLTQNIDLMIRERADLLACVRDFVALYAGTGEQDFFSKSVWEKVERARAALAKAEGR